MKNLKIFILMLIVVTLISGCASAGPWKGRVIDAETKQPIEGAVVVAVWYASHIASPGGPQSEFSKARETLTDKNGYFEIPVYRFLVIPFIWEVKPPQFIIFKPGYGSYPQYAVSLKGLRDFDFDKEGAVVALPKMNLNDRRYQLQRGDPDSFYDIVQNHRHNVPILFKLYNVEAKSVGMKELEW